MASASGIIPARVNGSPITLGAINVQAARNVTQRVCVRGNKRVIKQAKGAWKLQADLTFAVDAELNAFIAQIDPENDDADPVNIQVDLAEGTFNLTGGDANSLSFSSDQDGQAEGKVSLMFEGFKKVG